MLRVSNRACIRRLSGKSLRAAYSRNLIAILAIVLTTSLFTALFTIGLSFNEAFEQSNFRRAGGYSHGTLKYLTQQQYQTLRNDPLIRAWGTSRVLGMGRDEVLRKNHVELRWCDANSAHWMFLDPIEGRLPQEGTQEAATDLEVLRLLGVEPKLGARFTVLVDIEGTLTPQSFTLCGWWEKDPIVTANQILIPQSRVDEVLAQEKITLPTKSRLIGSWNLELMLPSARHIEQDIRSILSNSGYQCDDPQQTESYIAIGVNWGYTGAQLSQKADPETILLMLGLILLIMLTGYLMIYNVFQISVVNDIRFYGLLKTIGTTGAQLRSLLRRQAMLLCILGLPLGCLAGWLLGARLAPVIFAQLNGLDVQVVSVSPWIFVGAAAFSLVTVLLSCARPARMASRVSPVEAVRYTQSSTGKHTHRASRRGFSVWYMAWGNLGRNRTKTIITVLSLTLSLVLLQMTALFTNGFDMDKYLQDKSVCDFIVADGGYFDNNVYTWPIGAGVVPREVLDDIGKQGGITQGGCIYGQTISIQQFAPKEWVRQGKLRWEHSEQLVDEALSHTPRTPDGRVMDDVQLYGMEPFLLDRLTVLKGSLEELYQPGSRSVAAVYHADDYNNPIADSHWAQLGDTVTLRVPERWEYYDPQTGETHDTPEPFGQRPYASRPSVYRDESFTVRAIVLLPSTISYRYYGTDEFILDASAFEQLTQASDIMLYAFDVEDSAEQGMEQFLHQYTQQLNPRYGYESKQSYVDQFENMRSMFVVVGGLLSLLVGVAGVLNFLNAILTGILTRKRELAMLQSIGMTARQLKTMLIGEGLLYVLGSVGMALALSLVLNPAVTHVISRMFWFFTGRPTFTPLLYVTPVLVLLGCLVPLAVYHFAARRTIVERLRDTELS